VRSTRAKGSGGRARRGRAQSWSQGTTYAAASGLCDRFRRKKPASLTAWPHWAERKK